MERTARVRSGVMVLLCLRVVEERRVWRLFLAPPVSRIIPLRFCTSMDDVLLVSLLVRRFQLPVSR